MFSRKDTSFDLAAEMEKNLRSYAEAEVVAPINKIASAIDYLNRAAEIFDENGLYVEAEIATRLLEVFAAKKAKKKKSSKPTKKPTKKPGKASKKSTKKPAKTDEATKGLDSEKMIDNLVEKGWVFNADDVEYALDQGATAHTMDHDEGCDCSMCSEMNMVNDVQYAKSHGEGCMCSMCSDVEMMADDNFAHNMGPMDDVEYGKDEHEAELARIMSDLEDADRAGHEMSEFEDESDRDLPSNDSSRAMSYFKPGHNR